VTASMSVTLVNDRSEVERLSRLVEAFGEAEGLPTESIFSVNLALDEVVTNIIRYAYDDGRKHSIVIRLALEDGVLSAQVEDDGRAFNPLEMPPPDITASIEDRPIGGLGIHLVRSVMNSVEYRREDGRNVLIMKKRLEGSG
jgi:serine/threonine-protein kinase RsbW